MSTATTGFCSRCGRTMKATPRMHARHCSPPKPILIHHGTAAQRYYWRYQLWRAEHLLPASQAFTVRMAYVHWTYGLEAEAERATGSLRDRSAHTV